MKVTVIPVVVGVLGTVLKGLEKGWKEWKSEDYRIVEINQNTEKSPGDQRRLAVTQTQWKITG